MSRRVDEWIGKTDNSAIPPRVRLRIFEAAGGICYLCGSDIQAGEKWDCDHIAATINGGENRESNLKPAHKKCHQDKTKCDLKEKSKVAAVRKKHLSISAVKAKIPARPFAQTEKQARVPKPSLPYRQLYQEVET